MRIEGISCVYVCVWWGALFLHRKIVIFSRNQGRWSLCAELERASECARDLDTGAGRK
jgi:hypothetical protein